MFRRQCRTSLVILAEPVADVVDFLGPARLRLRYVNHVVHGSNDSVKLFVCLQSTHGGHDEPTRDGFGGLYTPLGQRQSRSPAGAAALMTPLIGDVRESPDSVTKPDQRAS